MSNISERISAYLSDELRQRVIYDSQKAEFLIKDAIDLYEILFFIRKYIKVEAGEYF